jgi:hypothetical protein
MATVRQEPNQNAPSNVSQFRSGPQDFSLVLGGPLFQLWLRSRLTGDASELLIRRIVVITSIAWIPLLLLSGIGSDSAGLRFFLRDIEVHVRFLVALPVLIAGELIVHQRITPVVRRFIERRIVSLADLPKYDAAINSAIRLRNSIPVEISMLVLVYGLGLWFWSNRFDIRLGTWYANAGGRWDLTPAGYWYVFISIPIAQFILLRWYWRLFIWYRFLWRVSRMDLYLISTHPDRRGGLAFLGRSVYAFGPLLFAQGAMLAGIVASRVLYKGESLLSFKVQIAAFVCFFVIAILGPLLMFTPQMAQAKRKGLTEYGQLAQDYVEDFEQKWVRRNPAPNESLLGTGDIQSLADLGNSYGIVTDMVAIPFKPADIGRLAAATAAPFLPLLLTIFSPEELILRIIKIVL